MQWEKLPDCPLHTECGDSGYIYQVTERSRPHTRYWIAVTIFENGQEMDTPCATRAEAKQVVESEAQRD